MTETLLEKEYDWRERHQTSKPDRGIIVHRSRCFNQRGEVVAESEATHLVQRKPAE